MPVGTVGSGRRSGLQQLEEEVQAQIILAHAIISISAPGWRCWELAAVQSATGSLAGRPILTDSGGYQVFRWPVRGRSKRRG